MYSWSVYSTPVFLPGESHGRGAYWVQSMRCEPKRSQTGGNNTATEQSTTTKTTIAGLEPWLKLPT